MRSVKSRELDLRHLLPRRAVVGDVLQGDAPLQDLLYLTDAFGDMPHGLLGEGDGQEVVEMTVVGAVAQMLGVGADAVVVQEGLDLHDEVQVERGRSADRERKSVTDERLGREGVIGGMGKSEGAEAADEGSTDQCCSRRHGLLGHSLVPC